ncbi:MAG TPA: VWA domain-containing protein [Candidatus Angelobacter sp.]|nr:VWA domain-containing protein [Candidatus Angelobacter sp.]
MLHLRSISWLFVGLFLTSLLLAAPQQQPQNQPAPAPTPSATEDAPASIGLLLDHSGSMRGKLSVAIAALQELVKASNAQDEFFVVNFNDDPYMDEDFTSDPKSIFEALGKMDARSGTAINDTVLASVDHLQKGAKYKKRIIVLVTDGMDNSSHTSSKKMLKILHEPGMPIVYAIGLFQYEGLGARKALDMLTQATGGKAFYSENAKQLNDMALQVAQEIRALKPTLSQDNHSSAVKH